jgi:type III secretion protein L
MSRNVIKGAATNLAPGATGSVVKRAVVESRAEARRILAEAEQEAAALRANAENAARELREAAYQEGREAAMLEITQLLLDIRQRRETVLAEVEEDVLRLSVKLAEKIIGREIEQRDATLADIVSTALRHARQQEMLVVRVNPADLAAIQAQRESIDSAARARFLDIIADPRVGRGGCLIESESGTVDAQLSTQLRVLERALLAQATTAEGE